MLADKAYSSRADRADMRRRGIPATIPVKADQATNRRKQRPSMRNATRYDKLAVRYLATLHVVAVNEWP